jgi:hypothetical protein
MLMTEEMCNTVANTVPLVRYRVQTADKLHRTGPCVIVDTVYVCGMVRHAVHDAVTSHRWCGLSRFGLPGKLRIVP